jgi:hypothetical protein
MTKNVFTALPIDLQQFVWKTYFTNHVIEQLMILPKHWIEDRGIDYIMTIDNWCLSYHGFIPFENHASGQRKIKIDFDEMYESEEDDDGDFDFDNADFESDDDEDFELEPEELPEEELDEPEDDYYKEHLPPYFTNYEQIKKMFISMAIPINDKNVNNLTFILFDMFDDVQYTQLSYKNHLVHLINHRFILDYKLLGHVCYRMCYKELGQEISTYVRHKNIS